MAPSGAARSEQRTTSLASNVRAELARQRRTGRQLAAAMDVDEHRVSKRVRGLVPFSAEEIVQVARFLDVSVEDLVVGPTARETSRDQVGAA